MANIHAGLRLDGDSRAVKNGDSHGPDGLCAVGGCRECPWEPCLTPEVIREFGFSRDDVRAIEKVAEAIFRSELTDDQAVELFDRVFGWCADSVDRWRAAS